MIAGPNSAFFKLKAFREGLSNTSYQKEKYGITHSSIDDLIQVPAFIKPFFLFDSKKK